MKKILCTFLFILIGVWSVVSFAYGADNAAVFEGNDGSRLTITNNQDGTTHTQYSPPKTPNNSSSNITGISDEKLRNGDVRMSDIPIAIASITQIIIGLAGTISILMLIYFAVKMQLASGFTGDVSGADSAKK